MVLQTTDSFADPAMMAARSLGTIPADRPYLEDALLAATQTIQRFCGWHVAPVLEETRRVRAVPGRSLLLPTLRLVDVLEVTTGGYPVDVSSLDWSEAGELVYGAWQPGNRTVVRFTHGYEQVPADLADLCLQVASRALMSPLGVVREQSLSGSVAWSQTGSNVAGGTVLLPHEQEQLFAYAIGGEP